MEGIGDPPQEFKKLLLKRPVQRERMSCMKNEQYRTLPESSKHQSVAAEESLPAHNIGDACLEGYPKSSANVSCVGDGMYQRANWR